jgi:hypothetical protein
MTDKEKRRQLAALFTEVEKKCMAEGAKPIEVLEFCRVEIDRLKKQWESA